jgi:hypothetical protein
MTLCRDLGVRDRRARHPAGQVAEGTVVGYSTRAKCATDAVGRLVTHLFEEK